MNISFENPDKINGKLTMVIEEADYQADVEKTLKDYRKRANIPGFRPGNVPMGLIKKQFGMSVKVDTINKVLGENLQKYIADNNIQMIGEFLAAEDQQPVELEKEPPYTFKFDIAVAPEFKVELTGKDKIAYYDVTADDKLIDRQVDDFARSAGSTVQAEQYDPAQNDILRGDLRELDAEGNTLEGGITLSTVSLMPEYIKVEDQQKAFEGAKPGDIVTFNPRKAYPDNDSEVASLLKIDKKQVAEHEGDFSFQVTEVSRFQKAEVNQELFDKIYGAEAGIKDEKQFRQKIADGVKPQLDAMADNRFLQDVRAYVEKKVGDLTYPEALLKRIIKQNLKEEKTEEEIDKELAFSVKELTWRTAKTQLAEANGIKINDDDVKAAATEAIRAQFAQFYGALPDEYLESYVTESLKKRENVEMYVDRALDVKLVAALKSVVKLDKKAVTFDEFTKQTQENS